MRPPGDCDAAFRARLKLRHAPSLLPEAKAPALAIRLQPCASFQEKLRQLIGKCPIKKGARKPGAFLTHRFRGKF
jgi:hypothetical protein